MPATDINKQYLGMLFSHQNNNNIIVITAPQLCP